jgi:hypothetical protein
LGSGNAGLEFGSHGGIDSLAIAGCGDFRIAVFASLTRRHHCSHN